MLIRSVATALDVLPLDSLGLAINDEVSELVELGSRQARKSRLVADVNDHCTMERAIFILNQFEKRYEPERALIKRVLNYLEVRSWTDCNHEVSFLEDEISRCLNRDGDRGRERDSPLLSSLIALMCYYRVVIFNGPLVEEFGRADGRSAVEVLSYLNPEDFSMSDLIRTDDRSHNSLHRTDLRPILNSEMVETDNLICPKTGEKLSSKELVPNFALKKLIQQFCADNGVSLSKSGKENPTVLSTFKIETQKPQIKSRKQRGRRREEKNEEEMEEEAGTPPKSELCVGTVTTLHLYQGAFVDIGGVYDGWVPIKDNDWYWIRQHIKVGMQVIVEVLAKRDPYRFRFPIELRFVDPNVDHLIFNRFEYPPIFHRDEDTNPDELRRDCGRPPFPRKDPGIKWEEELLLSNHPYVDKLWQIHVAEQMILDDLESNPDKYKGMKLSELTDEEEFDDEHSVEYTEVNYKKTSLPKTVLKTSVRELNLEAALAERELNNRLEKEAEERGEVFKIHKLARNIEMDEYDLIHWRRSFEEREALIRDMSNRRAVGLPLEEPGRYVDASAFGNQYDPTNPLYRYDYWGEPKNSEKSKLERITDAHNKSIVGKGSVWYEMSYEEAMKRKERKAAARSSPKEEAEEGRQWVSEDERNDDEDFDYSILGDSSADYATQPRVNGTESIASDQGLFQD